MQKSEHRSTARVLDILELLSQSQTGYTLTQISKLLNAPKSSLFPIIHTLENRNFIQRSSEDGYVIGQKAYLTGTSYRSERPVFEFIKTNMQKIVDTCQETCHLGILSGDSVLYIAKFEAKNPITLRSHVGQRLPAYCTGIGKALIYNLSKNDLKDLYPNGLIRYTENTIVSIDNLKKELDIVKESGFAYEHSELTEGIECIAIPLCHDKRIIASVSVCIPAYRVNDNIRKNLRNLLLNFRSTIEPYLKKYNVYDGSQLL